MLQWIKRWIGISALEKRIVECEYAQHEMLEMIARLRHEVELEKIEVDRLQGLVGQFTTGILDVHWKSPSMLMVVSTLGDGYFMHMDLPAKNEQELFDLVALIKHQFGTKQWVVDAMPTIRQYVKERMEDIR